MRGDKASSGCAMFNSTRKKKEGRQGEGRQGDMAMFNSIDNEKHLTLNE
jgi:hypothetical protein